MSTLLSRLAGLAALLLASSALALQSVPYSDRALADAQSAGKPVALHFHADWCGSCKVQAMVFDTLRKEGKPSLTVLVVNYDKAKEIRSRFGVRAQSTIIVFKGAKETARLSGEIRENRIRQALESAL
ncbi:MAG: thioredoxin family protein [Betaproteobacteria bacterium]|nr:thioredoxin family protein [Betaproteobacteria bacterium]